MANYYSFETRLKWLRADRIWLTMALDRLRSAKIFEESKFGLVATPARLETEMNYILAGIDTLIDDGFHDTILVTDLNIDIWAPRVTKSMLSDLQSWTNLAVDVDIGGTTSSLTVTQVDANPLFDVFDVADVVQITEAEDPDHNGFHTISVITNTVMTFNAPMLGSDNADDTKMVIELVER